MIKRSIIGAAMMALALVLIQAIATPAMAGEWSGEGRYVEISQSGDTAALVGERFWIMAPKKDYADKPEVRVEGNAISFLGSAPINDKSVKLGFEATEAGTAMIVLGNGKSEKRFTIKVLRESQVQAIKISDLMANPKDYKYRLFSITGHNCGWGPPMNVKEAWGERMTKSDWVLEDDTGAVNVTGEIVQHAPKLTVIAFLTPSGNQWVVWAVKVIEPAAVPEYTEMKADVKLSPKDVNKMKIGKIGVIEVNPDRSHVFDYEIEGDAISVAGLNRDELYLKADKEGEVVVKIYLRYWREVDIPDMPELPKPEPVGVYKIKVVKP